MKKFIVKAFSFSLLTSIALFFIVTKVIPPQFNNTYQYAINDKYKRLIETQSPKIIFLAGSNGAFGINEDIISKKTGMPVVNLALQSTIGIKFECELAKANIQKNDIVILGPEYHLWTSDPSFGADLVVSGIDNNIKLYQYVPMKNMIDVAKYFPQFSQKKMESFFFNSIEGSGVYQSSSFKNGNMIYDRPGCILPNQLSEKVDGIVVLNKNSISLKTIQYVNEFDKFVSNKGGKLLITYPSLLDEALRSNTSDTNEFQEYLSEKLDAPIISNINEYVFTREYMYNTIYHCNNKGEKRRSELLADDIVQYLNRK